jgi:hypothetical protein
VASAPSAHSTDTLIRQYGSASRADGVKARRYRASAGLALAALKWYAKANGKPSRPASSAL